MLLGAPGLTTRSKKLRTGLLASLLGTRMDRTSPRIARIAVERTRFEETSWQREVRRVGPDWACGTSPDGMTPLVVCPAWKRALRLKQPRTEQPIPECNLVPIWVFA